MGAPGKLGRYELITRIGQGGMAEVQLALQRGPAGFEKLVVVKLVHGELASQKAFVDMLLDEARVAALVKHPNVVDIYDLGEADGKYFIAMEYLEGEPLLSVLRAGREGKRLDPLSTGRLIADTAEGLGAAHELRNMAGERIELVHHDISLGNIVVLYNGAVKLVDFGVAKATSAASTGKVQGKFSYMAPEKLKGSPGDRRSDIFSLGCVMWEALTLKRLFRGANDADTMKQILEHVVQPPSKVASDIPVEYDAIVMRALDRDPAKRYSTAKDFANEIEELLRVRGYGAKNDRIGKYMQETFRDHIEARKKLVQEVVTGGSASAETVDAAFSQAAQTQLAGGSPRTPTMGDFSINAAPLGFAPGSRWITPPQADAFNDQKATEISSSPFDTQPADIEIVEHAPVKGQPTKIVDAMDWLEEVANDRRKRMIAAVVVSGVVLLLVVLMISKCGSSSSPPPPPPAPPAKIAAPVVDAAVIAPPPPPDAVDAPPPPPDAVAVVTIKKLDHRVAIATPPVNVDALFQKALQAYVQSDFKTSLALLKQAKAANPNHAPIWRLLGQVYKKTGERAQAKAAFSRYLVLAPNATDAATIRKEVE